MKLSLVQILVEVAIIQTSSHFILKGNLKSRLSFEGRSGEGLLSSGAHGSVSRS